MKSNNTTPVGNPPQKAQKSGFIYDEDEYGIGNTIVFYSDNSGNNEVGRGKLTEKQSLFKYSYSSMVDVNYINENLGYKIMTD